GQPDKTVQGQPVGREVEADDEGQELQFRERFAVHPAGDLRVPVIESREDAEQDSPDDHVMEMGDHEIGVAELPVERSGGHHHSGQHRDEELEEEQDAKEEMRHKIDIYAQNCSETVYAL